MAAQGTVRPSKFNFLAIAINRSMLSCRPLTGREESATIVLLI
jgi:hypothetical protein